ncbi:putative clathrin assembly protein At4g32285 [Tasmannia lanceolata]|uniref:putative clathrin assembly protein At4g32285 n=1 Tax=Tasmannia lanceolata TaxID=3420 RepID=UPI0040641BB1
MQRRFRQACTVLREHTAVGYAKIATITGFCDLELIVIKATAPDDVPLPEKYIHELIKIFAFSPTASRVFALSFTRRFGRTQCWRVALKCLILLHRLLRSLPESHSFRSHLLWSRSNGLLSFHPCHFRDNSSSASEDFTLFIRSYARLLDEELDCISFGEEKLQESPGNVSETMKEIGRVLDRVPQLQSLMDRVMDSHPIGAASRSYVIRPAMKLIIRDSFVCYSAFQKHIMFLLDNLFQMQYRSSISTVRIYKKAALQLSQLSEFYESCKSRGLCGSYEYPLIQKIPHIHVRALEAFLNERWELTESSSSTSGTMSPSDSPSTEDGVDRQLAKVEPLISTEWEKFEEENHEPLIQLETSDVSWEVLLEASTGIQRVPRSMVLRQTGYEYGYGYMYGYTEDIRPNETNGWEVQVYNPYTFNPFYSGYGMPNNYAYLPPSWI